MLEPQGPPPHAALARVGARQLEDDLDTLRRHHLLWPTQDVRTWFWVESMPCIVTWFL